MQGLNSDYLGHDAPTDVLAFDLRDDSGADEPLPVVAEIYICLDVAVNAASQYSTSVAYEVLLYIVHGMLHLVGENDHEQIERRRMRRAETRVMRGLQAEFPLDAAF